MLSVDPRSASGRTDYGTYLQGSADGTMRGGTTPGIVHPLAVCETTRDGADYILDTFPIVRRKDEDTHGEYRTKRAILEVFDAMQDTADTGISFESALSPAPGLGPRHPARSR